MSRRACVVDVSIVNCAVCQQFNKRTLLFIYSTLFESVLVAWLIGLQRYYRVKLQFGFKESRSCYHAVLQSLKWADITLKLKEEAPLPQRDRTARYVS